MRTTRKTTVGSRNSTPRSSPLRDGRRTVRASRRAAAPGRPGRWTVDPVVPECMTSVGDDACPGEPERSAPDSGPLFLDVGPHHLELPVDPIDRAFWRPVAQDHVLDGIPEHVGALDQPRERTEPGLEPVTLLVRHHV